MRRNHIVCINYFNNTVTKILDKHLKEEDSILAHGLEGFQVCLSDTVNLGRTSRQQEHLWGSYFMAKRKQRRRRLGTRCNLEELALRENHFLRLYPTHQNGSTIKESSPREAFHTQAMTQVFMLPSLGIIKNYRCQDFKQHNDWFWGAPELQQVLCHCAFFERCWQCCYSSGWRKGKIGRQWFRRQKSHICPGLMWLS